MTKQPEAHTVEVNDGEVLCAECWTSLEFVATIGAPGIGQAWECAKKHPFVKAYGTFTRSDLEDFEPPLLRREDVE